MFHFLTLAATTIFVTWLCWKIFFGILHLLACIVDFLRTCGSWIKGLVFGEKPLPKTTEDREFTLYDQNWWKE